MTTDELFAALPKEGSAFRALVRFCEDHRGRVLAALPWAAAEIAGNDGFDPMIAFVRRWSGARFYVPRSHARFVAKASLPIGIRTHRRFLSESEPASLIDIPSAWGVFLALRSIAVGAALEAGEPRSDVARRFGLSERGLRAAPSSERR